MSSAAGARTGASPQRVVVALPPPSGHDDGGGDGGSSSAGGEGAARQRVTPDGVHHRRVASRGHSQLGLWTVKVVVEKMRGFEAFGLSMPYVEVSVAGETKCAISLIPPTTSAALRASHSNARRGAAVSLSGTEDRAFNQEFRFTVLDATRALVISVKDLQKSGGSSGKGLVADSKVPLSSCTPNELKRGYFRTYFPGKGGKPAGEVLLSVLLIRPVAAAADRMAAASPGAGSAYAAQFARRRQQQQQAEQQTRQAEPGNDGPGQAQVPRQPLSLGGLGRY